MNLYKLRAIIDFIRRQGRLPADQFGNTLPPDEILSLYGLRDLLSLDEQRQLRTELAGMAEAEAVIDRVAANIR